MEIPRIVEHLCSRGHRGSTTNNEYWAAIEIKKLFTELQLTTEIQQFSGHKTFGEKLAIHLVPAILVAWLPLYDAGLALITSILLLLFILSFILEMVLFIDIMSKIFPRKPSHNVLARLPNDNATKRILFVAHYDSQKEGNILNPKLIDFMKKFSSPTSAITPIHLTFLSIVGLLITSSLFLINIEGRFGTFHLMIHIIFILWALSSSILVLEWAVGKNYVPGANDNATGVAVMLDLAGSISQEKNKEIVKNTEFWFLSTGCEETGLDGAFAFIRDNNRELRNKTTNVICLDGFGYGNIHYFTADGILITRPYDKDLIEHARSLTHELFKEDRSFICRVFTDGLAFSLNGFPSITFGSLDEDKLIKNYHWHTDIPENVDYLTVNTARDFLETYVKRITSSDHDYS